MPQNSGPSMVMGDPNRLLPTVTTQGFPDADTWLGYARRHGFRATRSERLTRCPECGGASYSEIGQYVHYSTLSKLRLCKSCGVAYSDRRLNPDVTRAHFEKAYKDERYFVKQRSRVFEQLVVLTDRCARRGGRVLDFGGAKGHFLAAVRRRRPDLRVTLIDISESACRCARETYGLEAICGSLSALKRVAAPFDVVVMSDVIYYEPEAATLWKLLPSLMADGGALLIRGPNVWRLIRVCQSVLRAVGTRRAWAHRDRIAFFNPEHLFVFSRRFLTRRLEAAGFEVVARPAELRVGNSATHLARACYVQFARLVYALSRGRWLLTPSLLLIARKRRVVDRGQE